MKKMNFWRTLLCSVMALTAFAACSDSDEEEGNDGIPAITANGATSATVAHDLTAGTTEAVTIESTVAWTLTFNSAADATWCTPSKLSGKKGSTTLTFDLAAATVAREATVTLSATGTVAGIPITKSVTVLVKQNAGGSTSAETNVAAVRAALKEIASETSATIEQDLTLTGIVISDISAGGTGGNKNCYIIDNSTDAGAGIIVRFNSAYTFPAGQVVTASLKGSAVAISYGALQITPSSDDIFTAVSGATETVEPIEVSDIDDLVNYESQFVKVPNVQPAKDARGTFYYSGTASYTTTYFETKDGKSLQISVYKTVDWAKTTAVPSKSGYICGIVTIYNGAGQVAPRTTNDVAGLTADLFEVESTATTIAQITEAGNFEVKNATVVATHSQGFLMNDGTGTMLVFQGNAEGVTVPAAGKKVNVAGTVELRGGLYQFGKTNLTVTETGTGSFTAPAIAPLDGAGMDALQAAPVVKYIKITGTLAVSGNYYNVTVDGATATGSISYATSDLVPASLNGKVIDVEGWYIGASGTNNAYFNIMATKVSENTSTPFLNISSAAPTFVAAGEAKEIAYTAGNLGSNNLYTKITGDGAAQFTVTTAPANGKLTVTAAANTETSAKVATLTVYAAASDGAEAVVSDEITLTQEAAASANQTVISLDFKDNAYSISTDYVKTGTQYTMGGYVFTLLCESNGFKYNASTNALLFGKLNAYIELPAIEGKKLVKVTITSNSGAATGQTCGIFTTGDVQVSGGAPLNWSKTDSNVYNLSETVVNTKYRLKSTTSSNCQINTLELVYN